MIGHDNRGQDPAWFLDEVDIDIPVRDEHYKFRCGGWLGGADPGQRKETVLFPGNIQKKFDVFFNIGRHYQNRALRGDTQGKRMVVRILNIELNYLTVDFCFRSSHVCSMLAIANVIFCYIFEAP